MWLCLSEVISPIRKWLKNGGLALAVDLLTTKCNMGLIVHIRMENQIIDIVLADKMTHIYDGPVSSSDRYKQNAEREK